MEDAELKEAPRYQARSPWRRYTAQADCLPATPRFRLRAGGDSNQIEPTGFGLILRLGRLPPAPRRCYTLNRGTDRKDMQRIVQSQSIEQVWVRPRAQAQPLALAVLLVRCIPKEMQAGGLLPQSSLDPSTRAGLARRLAGRDCSAQRITHTTTLSLSKDRQACPDNPRLLVRRPAPPPPRPHENLDPTRCARVRGKLMVKHSHVPISKSEIEICPLTPGKGRRGQNIACKYHALPVELHRTTSRGTVMERACTTVSVGFLPQKIGREVTQLFEHVCERTYWWIVDDPT